MKIRTLVTVFLILFVVASVAYVAFQEMNNRSTTGGDLPAVPTASGGTERSDRIIAYYFHGKVRCQTCRTIEAYAEEAIRTGYPEQIASGQIQWHAVNIEEPANEHFVRDFELVTRSVVLVHVKDGVQTEWKRLDKVWNLVHNKQAFVDYIYENADPMVQAVQ
jgi:hypothetical protein